MTQARNYAAKATRHLKRYYLTPATRKIVGEEGYILLRYIHHMLGEAVHFTVPDGGKLFDDNLRGLRGQELHLPYPAITVETVMQTEKDDTPAKVLALIIESSKSLVDFSVKYGWQEKSDKKISEALLFFAMYFHPKARDHWLLMPIGFRVAKDWDGGLNVKEPMLKSDITQVIYWEIEAEAKRKNRTIEEQEHRFALSLIAMCRPVFELCEALSCSNVTTEIVQRATNPKSKRTKKNKLPLFEVKTLVIDTQYKAGSDGSGGGGGKHSSPRQHLRRGHIRFLQSDRFKNKQGQKIWVNSTVVGSEGRIDKAYEVK